MSGSYVVDITLHSYMNPSGRCALCQDQDSSGTSLAGCCDEDFVRPSSQACPSTSACDPILTWCNTSYIGGLCGPFGVSEKYSANSSSINLETSNILADNTLRVMRDEPWAVSLLHSKLISIIIMCGCYEFVTVVGDPLLSDTKGLFR